MTFLKTARSIDWTSISWSAGFQQLPTAAQILHIALIIRKPEQIHPKLFCRMLVLIFLFLSPVFMKIPRSTPEMLLLKVPVVELLQRTPTEI